MTSPARWRRRSARVISDAPRRRRAPQIAPAENKSQLRFLTCGSVDDGKSTLIGRLLYDSKLLFEDQLTALAGDSRKHGTTGGDLDFALLVDGLAAEREQGITIDVAYRFFATGKRKFIVADTPGHEQYTRNMATGASNSDLAVILVDARLGILTQTRRHSFIVSLLGIRHVVLAVNKIDLVDFAQARFDEIVAEYRAFAADLGFETLVAVPLSALYGDNVVTRSPRMPWYDGPALVEHLETVTVADTALARPFRMPVQWVNRPHPDFRGFSGTVASGEIRTGDAIVVAELGPHQHSQGDRHQRRPAAAGRRRRSSDTDAGRRNRHFARRRAGRRPTHGRRFPTSSPRISSGCTTSRCFPAGPI